MDWLTYEFAKDFQSAVVGLIVGVVGFSGVILTLKSNARLARDQHELDRTLAREQHEREVEQRRVTLRQVVHAELTSAKGHLEINLGEIAGRSADVKSLQQFKIKLPITRGLLREIGVLTTFEVSSVMRALEAMDVLVGVLELFGSSERPGSMVAIDVRHVEHLEEHTEHVLRMCNTALDMLDNPVETPFRGTRT